MNVEDSYEGAVRRLNRLGNAGLDLTPEPENAPDDEQRMRDLEQLATLACDENEQLKQELGEARSQLGRLMQELDESRSDSNQLVSQIGGARGENERLTRELAGARGEIERQQRLTATLQEMLAGAQQSEVPSEDINQLTHELIRARSDVDRLQQLVATLQEMLATSGDEPMMAPRPSGRGPLVWILAVGLVGGVGAFLLMRDSRPMPVMAAAAAYQPSAPAVVAAPAPVIAKVEPPKVELPKVEPTIPKVAATIPKVGVVKARPQRKHAAAKHHPAKTAQKEAKHKSVARSTPRGDNPLEGLNL